MKKKKMYDNEKLRKVQKKVLKEYKKLMNELMRRNEK